METRVPAIQVNQDKTNLRMENSNSPSNGSRELFGSGKFIKMSVKGFFTPAPYICTNCQIERTIICPLKPTTLL